jgi:hypothetical protein
MPVFAETFSSFASMMPAPSTSPATEVSETVPPKSISRLMQKWRKDGVIEEHRGVIVLLDPKRLEALAEPR